MPKSQGIGSEIIIKNPELWKQKNKNRNPLDVDVDDDGTEYNNYDRLQERRGVRSCCANPVVYDWNLVSLRLQVLRSLR